MTETEVQVYDFEGKNVRTMVLNEEPWFLGKDIASALEYKDTDQAIRKHVDEEDKQTLTYKAYHTKYNLWSGNDYSNKVLISKRGVQSLLSSSNMPSAIELCESIGIEIGGYNNVKKEQRTLLQIMQAFNGEDMQRQYPVSRGKYRIDLYFPKYKLAIECDEFGHSDRPEGYDETRQEYIKNELNCRFIRYNPDSDNFSIFNVINNIINYIYNNKGVE